MDKKYYSTFLLISYTYVTLLWDYDVKSEKNAILYTKILYFYPRIWAKYDILCAHTTLNMAKKYCSTFILISYIYVTLPWWGRVGFYDVKSVKKRQFLPEYRIFTPRFGPNITYYARILH